MKPKHFLTLLAAIGLTSTISFAQTSENSNPYAIFGGNPYVVGERTDSERVKVLVIENIAEGSRVARLEHDTQTGVVTAFDTEGNIVRERQLKKGERAWLTMDRFAEKYYSISPYAFSLNNPVRYIDHNGDSVVLSGSQSVAAFQQLQTRLGGELNMSMSANGTIIASPIEGVRQSRASRHAMRAFGSTDITVNVAAENSQMTSTGNLYIGGAFMGNTVNANGTVNASQEVNPQVLGAMSNAYGVPGQDMLHEVTEAYRGGLISQRNGVSSPVSNQPNSVYGQAHNSAVPQ